VRDDVTELEVVQGVEDLAPDHGPMLAVVGVFDGIHLGHRYLLEHLVHESRERGARPAVITFDSHPDEILRGAAPPLLLDPTERLRLLGDAGVEVAVVEHFDEELRLTPFDAFIRAITSRTALVGLLMTPGAAFGHERRGTPETLSELGRSVGFEVVVVPPFALQGRAVSSSEIRRRVAEGDLAGAERLLGRPYGVVGVTDGERPGSWVRLTFPIPVALPPPGGYPVRLVTEDGDLPIRAEVEEPGSLVLPTTGGSGVDRLMVVFPSG
jgi:riboflavin kinase / FMN adenylyltransferase